MRRLRHHLSAVVVVLLLGGSLNVFAQGGLIATVTRDLTLRAGPGVQWLQLTIMDTGTTVALDGRDPSGTWARGITQNGDVGWMFINYISATPDEVGALPVIAPDDPITVSAPEPGATQAQAAEPAQAAADDAAAPAPAAQAPGDGLVITAITGLNIRRGDGTSNGVVGLLDAGEAFNVDGKNGAGTWLRGVSARGVSGWVSAQYTTIEASQIANLPVVSGSDATVAAPAGASAAGEAGAPVAPPAASSASLSGFSYGGHVRSLSEPTVNAMRRAGMTWMKKQVRYGQGADPNSVAGLIADAKSKGFLVLLGVVGDPGQLNNPGYNADYASFVAGLAGLGADAIEIWNETNLDREWPTGQIDPVMYTQLLVASYNAIKSVNSNTIVISAAMAPTGAEAAFPGQVMNDDNYLRGMVNAGALQYMDCVGAHYNEGILPPTATSGDPRSEYYTRYYMGMVNTYNAIIGGQRPICFTELGYLSPEGFPPLPGGFSWAQNVTVAQQAAWLDQVMSMAASSGSVRLVIVWNVDFEQYDADPMAGYAIIRPGGACPACDALGS